MNAEMREKEIGIAIAKVMNSAISYLRKGIRSDLVYRVLEKKIQNVLSAETVSEIRCAAKISRPKLDCNGKIINLDQSYVEEEELIFWSMASLNSPLNEIGYRRYAELFKKYFPEEAKRIKS